VSSAALSQAAVRTAPHLLIAAPNAQFEAYANPLDGAEGGVQAGVENTLQSLPFSFPAIDLQTYSGTNFVRAHATWWFVYGDSAKAIAAEPSSPANAAANPYHPTTVAAAAAAAAAAKPKGVTIHVWKQG